MKRLIKSSMIILLTSLFLVGCASTNKTEAPVTSTEVEAAEPAVEVSAEDEEYTRSTNHMEGVVSKDVFAEDKKIILEIINNLDKIMKSDEIGRASCRERV